MNKALIGLGIFVVLGLGILVFGSSTNNNTEQDQVVNAQPNIQFNQVSTEVTQGKAILYDVRTTGEYQAGHFASAANFPLQDLQADKLPSVDKTSTIYIYCQSGNRSAQAVSILKQAGYTNIVDLGGISDVQQIGGKLAKS